MFLLERVGVCWSAPHTDGEQVFEVSGYSRDTQMPSPAGKPSCAPKDAASGDG